jgi:Protein of unknown function (DUF4236)
VGSLRFRRSLKIAPGVRLNFNKRSIGISAGVPGARYSINSNGRRTRSVGIPGTGLSYRSQSSRRRSEVDVDETGLPSPTRLIASLVGWLTILVLVIAVFGGHPGFGGTAVAIGLIIYFVLRVSRGILDPLILWLLTRRNAPNESDL